MLNYGMISLRGLSADLRFRYFSELPYLLKYVRRNVRGFVHYSTYPHGTCITHDAAIYFRTNSQE